MTSLTASPSKLPHSPVTSLSSAGGRCDAVDLLRGLVMVLMALDHTRDYFHFGAVHGHNPLDLKTTTFALFFTRWITHFCAPVFVFLAGTGAFLSSTRGRSKAQLSRFLLTRGCWLIFLELTFIHWAGWSFAIDLHVHLGIVIWAIGWSMIALSALIHLPLWAITSIGLAMILGHNALDGIAPGRFGRLAWLWQILHAGGAIEYAPGYVFFAGYPLVPWIGVMAVGYGFGAVVMRPRAERRTIALRLGVALTLAFAALRFTQVYGDANGWTTQPRAGFTLLDFLDCVKYPPSLCYLLMTLGPALILLGLLDRETSATLQPLRVFGRVPMFYYLLHIPVIHGLAVLVETIRFGATPWLFGEPFGPGAHPPAHPDAGYGLLVVYLAWLVVLALLYPACRWFADLKQRRREPWLSYF